MSDSLLLHELDAVFRAVLGWDTPGILRQLLRKELGTLPTTCVSITAALEKTLGHSDDDAVRRILVECRDVRPDATDEEIVHFIELHGPRFCKMRSIDNPMGMLIRHLPRCLAGQSFENYREAERKRREVEADQEAEFEATQRRILEDPGSSDEDKAWARRMLS